MQFAIKPLREAGFDGAADEVVAALEAWLGRALHGAGEYPSFRCGPVLADWDRLRSTAIEPLLLAGRGDGSAPLEP
jgi:hypothetical protein